MEDFKLVKKLWDESYPLSSGKVLDSFVEKLKKSGERGYEFVEDHEEMISMFADVRDIYYTLERQRDCMENKTYFYKMVMSELGDVNRVLQNKFEETIRKMHQAGLDYDYSKLKPDNILKEVQKQNEAKYKKVSEEPGRAEDLQNVQEETYSETAQPPHDTENMKKKSKKK